MICLTCISVDHPASRDEETSHESQDVSELEALIDADLVPIVAQTIGSVLGKTPNGRALWERGFPLASWDFMMDTCIILLSFVKQSLLFGGELGKNRGIVYRIYQCIYTYNIQYVPVWDNVGWWSNWSGRACGSMMVSGLNPTLTLPIPIIYIYISTTLGRDGIRRLAKRRGRHHVGLGSWSLGDIGIQDI